MQFGKLSLISILIAVLVAMGTAAFADSWTVIPTPTTTVGFGGPYGGSPAGCGPPTCATTDYGGGDGSTNFITALGPFTFSNPQAELSVPFSWETWNCPPATESCTPNVLYNEGFSTLTISTPFFFQNIMGFELEPGLFQVETVNATFHSSDGDSFTLSLNPNGSAGALLFAVADSTFGAFITSVDINDTAGDAFAIAQLRSGQFIGPAYTPEPGTKILLGSSLLGALGVIRRRRSF